MIKTRSNLTNPTRIGDSWDRNLNQHSYYNVDLSDTIETLETYSHPGWRKRRDAGGLFVKTKDTWFHTPSEVMALRNTNGFLWYDGAFTASNSTGPSTPLGSGSGWGAIAYKRMKPTKPLNNLFNMVYELKDLPGMIASSQHAWGKELGVGGSKQFLGQFFGWMPLIGDVLQLIETQQKIQKRIHWLIKNQGKWVPREVTLLETSSKSESGWVNDWDAFQQLLVTQFYRETPQSRKESWSNDKVWASARFKWFLPDPPPGVTLNHVVKRALQGSRSMTTSALYRAIPWTWMIDWALNMGTVLENMEVGIADKLYADRFYIMRTQTNGWKNSARANMRKRSGGWHLCTASVTRVKERKTRVIGFPFEYGNPNSLSDTQWAIIGALGASKL